MIMITHCTTFDITTLTPITIYGITETYSIKNAEERINREIKLNKLMNCVISDSRIY